MPATGAQARSLGPPPRVPPATTTAVTRPGASADEIPCPAGTSSKRSKTDGTVTGTSMSTVPRHRRRDHAPEQRQACSEQQLNHCGCDHERRQQGRSPVHQRIHAHGDDRARRADRENVTGANAGDRVRLQRGAEAADDDGHEHGPGEHGFRRAGGAERDDGDHHHAAQVQRGELQPHPCGQGGGRIFVGLVTSPRVFFPSLRQTGSPPTADQIAAYHRLRSAL